FMRFLYEPENIGPYLEGSLGRWFPVMPELQNTAYWTETDDPHRQIHWRQYMERPQNPFPFVYNHRFIQVMTENAIGKAVGRMVLEDRSAEDAADELIARVQEVVGTDWRWPRGSGGGRSPDFGVYGERGDCDGGDGGGVSCPEDRALVDRAGDGLGDRVRDPLHRHLLRVRGLAGELRHLARLEPGQLHAAVQRSDLPAQRRQHRDLPRRRHQPEAVPGALAVRLLCLDAAVDPLAVDHLHPALGGAVDPDHPVVPLDAELGMGDAQQRPLVLVRHRRALVAGQARTGAGLGDHRPHLEIPAVLDADHARRAHGDLERSVRGGADRRRDQVAAVLLRDLAADPEPLPHEHAALDHLE